MKDPKDPGTLDLVEACARPLTPAERQKRLRDKRRRERQEGRRATLDFGAAELVVLGVALDEFAERWRLAPTKAEPAAALRARLPAASVAAAFPGDSAWLPVAMGQGLDVSDWPAHSAYQAEVGMRDPLAYRQTPYGQPEVDALVKPGDQVWTNYDSGPYRVLEVKRYECGGLRCYSLVMCALTERKPSAWINELVAVDGRLRKLFANNMDEVYVVGAGALAAAEPLPEPVRQLEAERAEKNAWYQEGRRLEGVVADLRGQVERLERERKLLEQERCTAMAAARVFEQRLRDAGLSTDYRG
ncbi:hypothetical protein [Pseudomonas aeruginosa]